MSYCRSGDESDVYLYHDVGGYINCCGCKLVKQKYHPFNTLRHFCFDVIACIDAFFTLVSWGRLNFFILGKRRFMILIKNGPIFSPVEDDPHFLTRSEAIEHLKLHEKKGHKVPKYAYKYLRQEIKEEGDKLKKPRRKYR